MSNVFVILIFHLKKILNRNTHDLIIYILASGVYYQQKHNLSLKMKLKNFIQSELLSILQCRFYRPTAPLPPTPSPPPQKKMNLTLFHWQQITVSTVREALIKALTSITILSAQQRPCQRTTSKWWRQRQTPPTPGKSTRCRGQKGEIWLVLIKSLLLLIGRDFRVLYTQFCL